MNRPTYFASDYVDARGMFGHGVLKAGGELTPLPIAAKGPREEALTIDVGWFGAPNPRRVLVHSSGVHGVEAVLGSAIQRQWLDTPSVIPQGTAIVLVHVVNPFGMAWSRRANEHNVDLNRNCLTPQEQYSGASPEFHTLDAFINPTTAPSRDFYPAMAYSAARVGVHALMRNLTRGQWVNPRGLFYGGSQLEEGPAALMRFVRRRMADVTHVAGIDVHSGMGPFGDDMLLVNDAPDTATFRALHATFGARCSSIAGRSPTHGASVGPESWSRAKGTYDTLFREALPETTCYFALQEFGTYSRLRVFRALRDENRRYHYGNHSVENVLGSRFADVFAPRSEYWRASILTRGRAAIAAMMDLLARA